MRRRLARLLLAGLLVAAAGGAIAHADGYVIPEPSPSSSIMADQKAVIVHRDGHEDLVISVGLDLGREGVEQSVQAMAWVIPVPSVPEVQTAPAALFEELDRISAPEIVYESESRGGLRLGVGADAQPPPVEVLERKEVGVYDVAVLAGREAGGLLDWLHAEGFQVPDALRPVLDAYIAEGWTFVAMRIAPGATRDELFDAEPIWLSFETGRMVYPMRLTGVRDTPLALRLYVLADHRYELEGFTVEFAGLAQVALPGGQMAGLLDREYFLTKLFDETVTPAEMSHDFYPQQAPTDELYRERVVHTYVSAGPRIGLGEVLFVCGLCWLGNVVLLALLVAAALILRRTQRR